MPSNQKFSAYERYAEIYDKVGGDDFSISMLPRLSNILHQWRWRPRTAVDLACGTGSMAVALAREGMQVTGLDLSAAMLERAVAKARAFPELPVQFRQADMRTFTVEAQVDLVTCFFDAMNYNLTSADLLSTFTCVAQALTNNGMFVFDMNSIHALSQVWGNDIFAEDFGDVSYIWDSSYDTATRCGKLVAVFYVQQPETDLFERFTEVHVERAYAMLEVKGLLEKAGLTVLEVVRPDGRSAQESDNRHVYVARKQPDGY